MDRLKKLRNVVIILIVLFVLNMVILTLMIPQKTFFTWMVVIAQAVVVLYFAAIAFGLIKEADGKDEGDDEI